MKPILNFTDVKKMTAKYGIKIYDFANVGNHLHILIKLSHKRFWAPFIREVTSKIAGLFEIKFLEQGRDSSGDAKDPRLLMKV